MWRRRERGGLAAAEEPGASHDHCQAAGGGREELQQVEEDLARLRETTASLRERIGERADDPTDAAEHSALSSEEQEFLIERLEARREELLAELGQPGETGR